MSLGSNPYAPPAVASAAYGPTASGVRSYYAALNGDVLVVQKEAALPPVCMKCGTKHEITRRNAKFQWTPMWARLMIVFCTLPGLIAMLATTKRGRLELPLCVACNARWGQAVAAIVVGIVALVGALLTLRSFDEPAIGAVLFFVGLVAFLGLVLGFAKPRLLQVHKIDERNVELKGFHPDAARVIVG